MNVAEVLCASEIEGSWRLFWYVFVFVNLATVTADSGSAGHSSQPVHFRQQKKLKTKAKPFIEPTDIHVCIKFNYRSLCLSVKCFFT